MTEPHGEKAKTFKEALSQARARDCCHCGKPLSFAQRPTMQFCSDKCRVAAFRARARGQAPEVDVLDAGAPNIDIAALIA